MPLSISLLKDDVKFINIKSILVQFIMGAMSLIKGECSSVHFLTHRLSLHWALGSCSDIHLPTKMCYRHLQDNKVRNSGHSPQSCPSYHCSHLIKHCFPSIRVILDSSPLDDPHPIYQLYLQNNPKYTDFSMPHRPPIPNPVSIISNYAPYFYSCSIFPTTTRMILNIHQMISIPCLKKNLQWVLCAPKTHKIK